MALELQDAMPVASGSQCQPLVEPMGCANMKGTVAEAAYLARPSTKSEPRRTTSHLIQYELIYDIMIIV